MAFYGADVGQLRELAKAADRAANLLSTKALSLQNQIMAAPWKGSDGERFRHEWNANHRPGLDRVVSSLRNNARILLQNADEQERSSASATGSTRMTGLETLQQQYRDGRSWLSEQTERAAALAEHRRQLAGQLSTMLDAGATEQAQWWAGLSAGDRKYLIEGQGADGPLAVQLMKLDGGVPILVQQQARDHLTELKLHDISFYRETGKAEIEGQLFWAQAGAIAGAEVVENFDGSATLKVYGNLGIGVTDHSGTAGATLNGEASRQYTFDSAKDAVAARDQMFRELPPDSLGDAENAVDNAPGYILDAIEKAARDNGASGHTDSAKGSVELAVEGGSETASGSAALNLAYERNLTEGTSTASAEVSAGGRLSLNGEVFEADGKSGLQVQLDADSNISSISVQMEGSVSRGLSEELKTGGVAETSVTAGAQGTVRIDIPYTPDNRPIIDSYMRNIALGNDAAAGRDAALLYEAGSATVQVNALLTNKNEVGFDVRAAEVKVSTENQVSTNVSTYHKVQNDTKLQLLEQS